MLPAEQIQAYGGKAAILNHVKEALPGVAMPGYFVISADESARNHEERAAELGDLLAVRSSSPHEYADFEGIFESEEKVKPADLEKAVRHVRASATSERARKYAEQHGFTIDDKMHVIVQAQSPSKYKGAMMRHPNDPDKIYMCWWDTTKARLCTNYLYDETTGKYADSDVFISKGRKSAEARELVEVYKQIEQGTDIAPGYALVVEVGLEPTMVYQVRPFKKIETADFEVPELQGTRGVDGIATDFAMGITPPEGIVLPVLRSFGHMEVNLLAEKGHQLLMPPPEWNFTWGFNEHFLQSGLMNIGGLMAFGASELGNPMDRVRERLQGHHEENDREIGEPYCFMPTSMDHESYDAIDMETFKMIRRFYDHDLNVPNMEALITTGFGSFVVHDMMRILKKAKVTVGARKLWQTKFFGGLKTGESKVRIISNGKKAIALRETSQ